MKRVYFVLLTCSFFLGSTVGHALPFTIAPKAGTTLPTILSAGRVATAYYTITNNTAAQRNNNYIKYLPPHVAHVKTNGTFSDTCGATFNLAKKGQAGDSCTLQLTVSGPVDSQDPNPKHHLFACFPGGVICAGTKFSLHVIEGRPVSIAVTPTANIRIGGTQQFTAMGIYADNSSANLTSSVTWHSSVPAAATISASGLATGLTLGATDITASFDGIRSNTATLTVSSFAYVTNGITNSVTFCLIQSDGSFGACNTTGNGFIGPLGITINPAGNFAYVTNFANDSISLCPVNSDGSFGNCQIMATNITIDAPVGITIDAANAFAYVGNNDVGTVAFCPILRDGTFGSCTLTAHLTNPLGVAINPSSTNVYVGDNTSNVSFCPINNDGSLGVCTNASVTSFITPRGIAFNPAGTLAYVTSSSTTVSYCTLNGDGSFNVCTPTGAFIHPSGIAINSTNTFAYITNSTANNVSFCLINNNGSFDTCNLTGSSFSQPTAIVVH